MMGKDVFISYVHEDASSVARLCADLKRYGVTVWLDRNDLMPGVRWKSAIMQAIQSGSHFIACFSESSTSRERTHMNEEITVAIDELRQRSTSRSWFLPVRLTPCKIPDREIGAGETLASLQVVDLHTNWDEGLERLLLVITQNRGRTPEENLSRAAEAKIDRMIWTLRSGSRSYDYWPSDDDNRKRHTAIEEILEYGVAAVPQLIKAVTGNDDALASECARILSRIRRSSQLAETGWDAVPVIIGKLSASWNSLKQGHQRDGIEGLIFSLGSMGDERSMPLLLEIYLDAHEGQLRQRSADSLLSIGYSAFTSCVKSMMESNRQEHKVRAAAMVMRFRDWTLSAKKPSVNFIIKWSTDDRGDLAEGRDDLVSRAAALEAGGMPEIASAAVRMLLNGIEQSELGVALPAIVAIDEILWSLVAYDLDSLQKTLIVALSHSEPSVRIRAASCLGREPQFANRDTVAALITKSSDDPSAEVTRAIEAALDKIRGRDNADGVANPD